MKISRINIEKWLPHFIGLLLFLLLPVFAFDRSNDRAIYWIYSYYYQLAFMIVAFYVNYLLIVPHFFFSKKRIYFFGVILVFTIFLLVTWQFLYDVLQLENLRPGDIIKGNRPRHRARFGIHPKILDNFFLLLLVLGFSSGMAIIQQLRKNQSKQKEIDKARVDSELAFLKNQISPHFFFNSLNNIYALIAIDGEKAQKAVEKLSILMRYLIYDSNIKMVELQKEFEFTQNYVDLMKQRLNSKVKLEINIQQEIPKVEVPPLLFIPFIENSFKHGISYRENSCISIDLQINNEQIIFNCKNSIPQQAKEPGKKGGIGIVNIKKRLALIYGEAAQLDINDNGTEYSVHLIIPLAQKI